MPEPQSTPLIEKKLFDAWAKVLLSHSKVKGSEDFSQQKRLTSAVGKLTKEIEFIRESYQINRRRLDGKMMQHFKTATAYQASFHLPNALRMFAMTTRMQNDLTTSFWDTLGDTPCLYDLGCGTGALSTGVLATLPEDAGIDPKVFLFDSNRHLLKIAEDNIRAISEKTKPKSIRIHLQDLDIAKNTPREGNSGAVYFLGYVWNEIQKNPKSLKTLHRLFEKLAGLNIPIQILVLEPATDANWNTIKSLRNSMVDTGMQITYPCPHDMHCPLEGKDRCFSEFPYNPGETYKRLESHQAMFRDKLATSCFSFVNKAYAEANKIPARPNRYVGFPQNTQDATGGFFTLTCTQEAKIAKEQAPATAFTRDKKLRCSSSPSI